MSTRLFTPIAAALILTLAAAPATSAFQNTPQNPDAAIIADFLERVKRYAALHDKLESSLPTVPTASTPELIAQHQSAMERLLTRARANARRGDIFTDPVRAYIRRQLSRVFSGPDGARVRATILDEDTRAVKLTVNSRYPSTVPVSTVPPQVLLVLPRLPEALEYRFVGDTLVLLDIHAGTVVDFMEKALG
jgi:hypothetical protein